MQKKIYFFKICILHCGYFETNLLFSIVYQRKKTIHGNYKKELNFS